MEKKKTLGESSTINFKLELILQDNIIVEIVVFHYTILTLNPWFIHCISLPLTLFQTIESGFYVPAVQVF